MSVILSTGKGGGGLAGRHPPGAAAAAEGMHSIGMHSCLNITHTINIFTVCNTVHRGRVSADTPGQTPSRQTPGHPPPHNQTATVVDGVHPTGMHSCFVCLEIV